MGYNNYDNYDNRVKQDMLQLEQTLHDEIGDFPMSYYMQLRLLADNLELYYQVKDQIETDGLLVPDVRGGNRVKHPLLATMNAISLMIGKLINTFGLSRMARSKIRENKDSIDMAEYIKTLTD